MKINNKKKYIRHYSGYDRDFCCKYLDLYDFSKHLIYGQKHVIFTKDTIGSQGHEKWMQIHVPKIYFSDSPIKLYSKFTKNA